MRPLKWPFLNFFCRQPKSNGAAPLDSPSATVDIDLAAYTAAQDDPCYVFQQRRMRSRP